jgi:hypothetical protein
MLGTATGLNTKQPVDFGSGFSFAARAFAAGIRHKKTPHLVMAVPTSPRQT